MSLVEERLKEASAEGRIACAKLFEMAAELGVAPVQFGTAASEMDLRIEHCQLGAFGYDTFGERRLLRALPELPEPVATALAKGVVVDGRLPCVTAWKIAEQFGLPRFVIGCAAETLGLRIGPCQLGCF
ncbi:hypothetical protein JW848_11435 [Candidatus Bipolaricaulota bacterium]|nr:hypothetical protein [Candidatus Bipolaricaulota bacterium]